MGISNDQGTSGVIKVGDGRGFVVLGSPPAPWVITAAHCLPFIQPATPGSFHERRTYSKLLGELGGERTVWAKSLFVDPVADIAVLGCPDSNREADDYLTLTLIETPLLISDLPTSEDGTLLSGIPASCCPRKTIGFSVRSRRSISA